MPVTIEILNIKNNAATYFGQLTEEEIIQISEQAKKLNLANLQYVDYVGETVFNPEQIKAIKYEVEILTEYPEIRKNLKLIKTAINGIQENTDYLSFSGE